MPRNISRRALLTRFLPVSAALGVAPSFAQKPTTIRFEHGVASGDPVQTAVIIWTRVSGADAPVDVQWEVAADDAFTDPVKEGVVRTDSRRDYTVKVDVDGLVAGQEYFYRFKASQTLSPTGRTKTLPTGALSSFKIGVCSCANYPAGYFNAYGDMAAQPDLDLVIHLGDYIYEYHAEGYASAGAEALGRVSDPRTEVISLADYRLRHAQYKSDPNLQKLHAALPFILSWDDHETANDGWRAGAENHNDEEGDWQQRKAVSLQAYYEWMPIREPDQRALDQQWRAFEIGDLATLIMLETRLSARDKPVDLATDLPHITATFDVRDPDNISIVEQAREDTGYQTLPLPFDYRQGEATPITDYRLVKEYAAMKQLPEGIVYHPDMERFRADVLNNPERQILGDKQREFVVDTLKESTTSKKPWQLIGNQTLISEVTAPNFADWLSDEEKQRLADWIKPLLGLTRLGTPFGLDSWNGYGAERQWFYSEAADHAANTIVLTGDTHAAWALEMNNADGGWRGVELGTTSISSPGLPDALGLSAARLDALLKQANANLHYVETGHRGYLTVKFTREQATAEFHQISSVADKTYRKTAVDTWVIDRAHPGKLTLNRA